MEALIRAAAAAADKLAHVALFGRNNSDQLLKPHPVDSLHRSWDYHHVYRLGCDCADCLIEDLEVT